MKNAFVRMGYTCALMLAGLGLATGSLEAEAGRALTVNLPHAVEVRKVMLPAGEYTISSMDLGDGDEYFLVRSAHSTAVTVRAQKILGVQDSDQTKIVLSNDGETWHLDKMFLSGDNTGYQFSKVGSESK